MANPNQEDTFVISDDDKDEFQQQPFDDSEFQENYDDTEVKIGGEDYGSFDPKGDEVEITNPVSAVASAPAKNILIIAIMVIASGFIIYSFFFEDSVETAAEKKKQEQIAEQPSEPAQRPTMQDDKPQVNIGVVDTPELPQMENVQPPAPLVEPPPVESKIEVPAPSPPPVAEVVKQPELPVKIEEPLAEPTSEPPFPVVDSGPQGPTPEQRMMERRKSGMMIINGGGVPVNADKETDAIQKSAVTPVKATKVEDLGLMILQGKMIDAVLETTINTDLPGSLRAVISRDIYAESGKTILIPRGSRLIGTYSNSVETGQQRVLITWGRVIRPDGVDIDIASSGTDQLGRAGMTGIVDNKYFEIISNSLLVSIVTIGGSMLLDSVQQSQQVTTTESTGSGTTTSQTASPTDSAILQSTQNFGETAKKLVDGLSTKPTIIVNQGSRIKVFVNKDLIFPESVVKRVYSGN